MIKMSPDYQQLTLIQKVEVFESLLQNTSAHDLRKALWLKSPSASVLSSISISLRCPFHPAAAVGGRAPTPARAPSHALRLADAATRVHVHALLRPAADRAGAS